MHPHGRGRARILGGGREGGHATIDRHACRVGSSGCGCPVRAEARSRKGFGAALSTAVSGQGGPHALARAIEINN